MIVVLSGERAFEIPVRTQVYVELIGELAPREEIDSLPDQP
ncbi:MAG TPA: hypothetical protein VM425_05190 [Myxococcota bacterium]|nr:hypothetical protein [Myxococcota bacterium]